MRHAGQKEARLTGRGERKAQIGALSGTLSNSRETSFEIWHLVPIILSICLCNIYSHGRRVHVCGMRFLCRTCLSRERGRSTEEGHAGVMAKNKRTKFGKSEIIVRFTFGAASHVVVSPQQLVFIGNEDFSSCCEET